MTEVPPLGTVLGIWAHPDDETYLTAGIMAASVRRGDRVVCVTATRGELGSFDEERWPTATLGAVREKELLASLSVLGVTEHVFLDYADGGCAGVPRDEAIGRVRAIMEEVRPDAVFSFGPDGMTGHPDHKSTCEWATEAFRLAAKPGARLYYATTTPEWASEFVPAMQPFNVFMEPGTPPVTPPAALAVHVRVQGELLDRKLEAISKHVSQVEGMLAAFGPDYFKRAMVEEPFVLATEASSHRRDAPRGPSGHST